MKFYPDNLNMTGENLSVPITPLLYRGTLLVEDGSVDVDKLIDDGFYVIVYRKGSTPPILLEK